MAETLALLAALAFALGTTLQQRGALRTPAPEGDPRFLAELLREPVWWLGAGLQAAGWVLQAAALDRGSLVVVQALCTLSLVFALPFGVWLTDQHVGLRSIIGASAATVGIVSFVAAGHPEGGTTEPAASAWWASGLAFTAVAVLLTSLGRRRGGTMAATLFAVAAGLAFAFQAAVTKVFVGELGNGLDAILSTWTTYALIATALAGFALQQGALKTGFLAPAMAGSNASTLVGSVILGVWVFDETLVRHGTHVVPPVVGLAVAIFGVVLLATTGAEPEPDTHDQDAAQHL